VCEAAGEGAYSLIQDEGTMTDFLDPDDDAGRLVALPYAGGKRLASSPATAWTRSLASGPSPLMRLASGLG
jgi:hypothetical protein